MAYEVPSVLELQDRALAGVAAEFPNLRTTPGSEANADTLANARLVADNHQRLGIIERNALPSTADETGLEQWAIATETPRKGATVVTGSQALEATGTPTSPIGIGEQLQHSSGLVYQTTSAAVIGSGGTAVLDIQSVDTGQQTRLNAGEPLTFLTPPAGVNQAARLLKSLIDGGNDEEPIGEWRDRIVRIWRDKRVNGSESGYISVALAQDNIVKVYLYRRKPTAGSLSVAGFKEGFGSAKTLTPSERTVLESVLQAEMINDTVIVLDTVPRLIHATVDVSLLPNRSLDFSSQYIVDSWNAGTSTLTVTTALAADVGPGDLLSIDSANPDASGATGKPAVVAAVTSSTTLVLTPVDGIQPVLDFVPANGDIVNPSSSELYAAWRAIRFGTDECVTLDGLEELGPANGAGLSGSRPPFHYGDWRSDFSADDIEALAKSVTGIGGATAVLSTASVAAIEFEFPDDDQVEILLPGQVIVR